MVSKTRASFDVQITGDDAGVRHMLDRLDSALSPAGLAVFLGVEVGPYLKGRLRERFASEGDDVTGSWLPLAESTVAIRQQLGFAGEHPINIRTHQMELYLLGAEPRIEILPGGASLRYPGTTSSSKVGQKIKTAQIGSSNPVTPPRPVLGMNEKDLEYVLVALALGIKTGGSREI